MQHHGRLCLKCSVVFLKWQCVTEWLKGSDFMNTKHAALVPMFPFR